MTTIHQAINEVRRAIGIVAKDGWNSQSNYAFRGVDAVVDAAAPVLIEHGVLVLPQLLSAEYTEVLSGKNRTPMSSVRLQVKFTWYGPEGDSLETCVAGEAFDSGDKATAKAHSVAYRTCLIETLTLRTADRDPDKDTYRRSPQKTTSTADDARQELLNLLGKKNIPPIEAEEMFTQQEQGDISSTDNAAAIKRITAHYRKVEVRS